MADRHDYLSLTADKLSAFTIEHLTPDTSIYMLLGSSSLSHYNHVSQPHTANKTHAQSKQNTRKQNTHRQITNTPTDKSPTLPQTNHTHTHTHTHTQRQITHTPRQITLPQTNHTHRHRQITDTQTNHTYNTQANTSYIQQAKSHIYKKTCTSYLAIHLFTTYMTQIHTHTSEITHTYISRHVLVTWPFICSPPI